MKQKKETSRDTNISQSARGPAVGARPPVLAIDFEEFAHFFEDEDMTEEQAREFLQVYWAIALEIMSLGFGIHPVQQAQDSCGKLSEATDAPPHPAQESVYLTPKLISENFEHAAGSASNRAGKESKNDAI